jgi:4-amino-4-deoxy-L-arabinose transferase-like glycosyltransferase
LEKNCHGGTCKMMVSMIKALKQFGWQEWLVVIIVLTSAFVRLYNLPNSLHFQGDQGRDALLVSQIFKDFDPVFIGPVTSVGNMYLGPFYYYFMLPFLWLTYPSPVGPAYAVALAGVLTTWLLYRWGKEMVGGKAALIAALFYAFSSMAVLHNRFSWNPNIAPLLSLIVIYCTFKAWQSDKRYWAGAIIAFSLLIQLHYLALLAAGGVGLIWLMQLYNLWPERKKILQLLKMTGLGAAFFLLTLAPLVLFDYKHGWLNARAFTALFTRENSFYTPVGSPVKQKKSPLKNLSLRSSQIMLEPVVGKQDEVGQLSKVLVILIVGTFAVYFRNRSRRRTALGEAVLVAFLVTGIVGTSFYQHSIFAHYLAYLWPVSFLVLGSVLAYWMKKHLVGAMAAGVFIIFFLYLNIPQLPLQSTGWTIYDMDRTAQSILERVEPGEKYNIVLLSESRDLYGQNYRYFLDTNLNKRPINPERQVTSDVLFIINEERVADNPIELPIYQIEIFPNKDPHEIYSVEDGPEIIVLRR